MFVRRKPVASSSLVEKQAGKGLDGLCPFLLQMCCGNSMNNAYKFKSFLSG